MFIIIFIIYNVYYNVNYNILSIYVDAYEIHVYVGATEARRKCEIL